MGISKYTTEERLKIGKEIFDKKLTRFTAAVKYDISPDTARNYMRYYKALIDHSDEACED